MPVLENLKAVRRDVCLQRIVGAGETFHRQCFVYGGNAADGGWPEF